MHTFECTKLPEVLSSLERKKKKKACVGKQDNLHKLANCWKEELFNVAVEVVDRMNTRFIIIIIIIILSTTTTLLFLILNYYI